MSPGRTRMLVLIVLAAALCEFFAHRGLRTSRGTARAAAADLQYSAGQIAQINRWRSGSSDVGSNSATIDASQLNRLIRDAAAEAGASERLASIEPGQPSRLAGEYVQLPLFLRLESISMKELTLFLHRLATMDASSRAQSIELSAAGARGDVEVWHADVAIAYLNYSPEGRQ